MNEFIRPDPFPEVGDAEYAELLKDESEFMQEVVQSYHENAVI